MNFKYIGIITVSEELIEDEPGWVHTKEVIDLPDFHFKTSEKAHK